MSKLKFIIMMTIAEISFSVILGVIILTNNLLDDFLGVTSHYTVWESILAGLKSGVLGAATVYVVFWRHYEP